MNQRMIRCIVASLIVLMVGGNSVMVSGLLSSVGKLILGGKHQQLVHHSNNNPGGGRHNKRIILHGASPTAGPSLVIGEEEEEVVDLLLTELNSLDLGSCHGVLHACGLRRLTDAKGLSSFQLDELRFDDVDHNNLLSYVNKGDGGHSLNALPAAAFISTTVDSGAFDRPKRQRFEVDTTQQDFDIQVICAENDIFKGTLFTPEQCMQINRMAESHAYRQQQQTGVRGGGDTAAAVGSGGWTNEFYTLTAQHMQCKDVPGLLPTTDHVFRQLKNQLYDLFPGRIRKGSIVFENDGEPHLVKYHGKAKGTILHTDNAEFVYITVNVMLSEDADFVGGGTYIQAIDETIRLKQGEMLIHLGDLEHAGVDIHSGVRRLLISFYACEWEQDELNQAKLEHARDYVPPSVAVNHNDDNNTA